MENIKLPDMPDPFYVQCSCLGEGLVVEPDLDEDLGWYSLDISFWSKGFNDPRSLSFRDKIRFCKRILTKGRPYGDMVCLNIDETKKLRNYLNEQIEARQKHLENLEGK